MDGALPFINIAFFTSSGAELALDNLANPGKCLCPVVYVLVSAPCLLLVCSLSAHVCSSSAPCLCFVCFCLLLSALVCSLLFQFRTELAFIPSHSQLKYALTSRTLQYRWRWPYVFSWCGCCRYTSALRWVVISLRGSLPLPPRLLPSPTLPTFPFPPLLPATFHFIFILPLVYFSIFRPSRPPLLSVTQISMIAATPLHISPYYYFTFCASPVSSCPPSPSYLSPLVSALASFHCIWPPTS
jgi:hypothetical protein